MISITVHSNGVSSTTTILHDPKPSDIIDAFLLQLEAVGWHRETCKDMVLEKAYRIGREDEGEVDKSSEEG